jgi:hypothetical protein
MELFNCPGIEKEMNLSDLKIFFTLFTDCQNLVENNFFFKENFRNQINTIIKYNKSIEANHDLTKHLFHKLQFERNEYIYKSLLGNMFSLIKKTDEDNLTIQYFPYFSLNLKTINPSIILKSELLLNTVQTFTKELNSNENYKGFASEYLATYFNIFPKIGVDITQSDSFIFHSKFILFERLNELPKLSLYETFDYFEFFLNFKNICDFLTFRDKIEINRKFKDNFKSLMEREKFLLETSEYHGTNELNKMNKNYSTIAMDLRYDEICKILSIYKDDCIMINLCEVILHLKLKHHICPVNILMDIVGIYLNHLHINKNILHFIAFNCIEHLSNTVTKYSFEKDFVLIFGLICNFSQLVPNSETISEFFEEFKSTLFHNRFLNLFEKDMGTLSNRSLVEIRNFHDALKDTNYFDKSFAKFVDNTINLSSQIVTILL